MLLLGVVMLTAAGQIRDVLAGLAITFATGVANQVFLLTWGLTDMEVQMNSVKRLREHHDNLPQEGHLQSLEGEPEPAPKKWPRQNSMQHRHWTILLFTSGVVRGLVS